jgi:hypothetical protein
VDKTCESRSMFNHCLNFLFYAAADRIMKVVPVNTASGLPVRGRSVKTSQSSYLKMRLRGLLVNSVSNGMDSAV